MPRTRTVPEIHCLLRITYCSFTEWCRTTHGWQALVARGRHSVRARMLAQPVAEWRVPKTSWPENGSLAVRGPFMTAPRGRAGRWRAGSPVGQHSRCHVADPVEGVSVAGAAESTPPSSLECPRNRVGQRAPSNATCDRYPPVGHLAALRRAAAGAVLAGCGMPTTLVREDDGTYRLEIRGLLTEGRTRSRPARITGQRWRRDGRPTVRLLVRLEAFEGWETDPRWNDLSFYVVHGDCAGAHRDRRRRTMARRGAHVCRGGPAQGAGGVLHARPRSRSAGMARK